MQTDARRTPPLTLPDDRTVDRLIRVAILVLAIGIPLIAFIYWSDRHVTPTPSITDRAIAAAEAAVRANPGDLTARNSLAAAYVTAKRYDEGIEQFTQVISADATNAPARIGRGLAYIETDRLDLATADFQAMVDALKDGEFAATDPKLETAYYYLGEIALKQADAATAVERFRSALMIDGGNADALYGYSVALIRAGNAKDAVAPLRQAVLFVPSGWREPYAALVEAYTALGDTTGTAYASAMVLFCDGDLAGASTGLEALVAGPMAVDALLGLGLVSAGGGDNAAAVAYYEQVLAIDPTNVSAQIGLGQVSAQDPAPPAVPTAGSN
jgi:tetratricopeptide (TPR) repeat protein